MQWRWGWNSNYSPEQIDFWNLQYPYLQLRIYGAPRHAACEEHRSVHCTEAGTEQLFVELPDRKANLFRLVIGQIFVNNQLDAQFLFVYIYFYSLYVSGSHVPIIRRINCNRYDIWYMSLCIDDSLVYRFGWNCVSSKCRIDTINSPDDGHMAARNM